MPYTTAEQVRNYLFTNAPLSRRQLNQPVIIDSNEPIPFFGGSIKPGSLTVKSIRTRSLQRVRITAGSTVVFANAPVVPDSVVAANDSSLGTIYAESIDYLIDYAAGTFSLVAGGAIAAGAALTLWFQSYSVYAEGSDYSVNAERGEIRRLLSGDIVPGETVYLDYTPEYVSATEQVIAFAVTAANGVIERAVDPSGQFEADPVLGIAATYRALEIICRAAASRDLSYLPGQDRSARVWIQLAGEYATRADNLLTSFRPPVTPMSSPTLS
ncbi:MAG: hypothetical protein HY851_00650 [candidate division Zixibacteria bacterium]|nr:hypothetical protein [candidate division Zixibacteria bacterium]